LCARGVDLVAICGGDGTGQIVLTMLHDRYRAAGKSAPAVVLLRGGTMNTVARNLAIEGTPESILASLIARIEAGTPLPSVQQPLVVVNGRHGFLFAAALGARFLQLYYDTREPGPVRAALLALRVATSAALGGGMNAHLFHPAGVTLTIDDDAPRRLDARLLIGATIPDVGVGMRLAARAGRAPERFHLLASSMTPLQMAARLAAVRAGTPLTLVGDIDQLARRAQLRFEEEEPYTVDGDIFHARELELATSVITLVRP
jgi:diacylglycerol kinase family enzyme